MHLLLKVAITVGVVLAATAAARRYPMLAGFLGVMPLAGAMALAMVFLENDGDRRVVEGFLTGALWGIVPSVLFYLAAWACLKRDWGLAAMMGAGFGAWLAAAGVLRLLLR